MKNLKEYIKEGLFDDLDKIEKIGGMDSNVEQLKKEIIDWIKRNTYSLQENKLKFDFNTTPITINYDDDIEFKKDITSLTKGLFQWGEVKGYFYCAYCESLTTLEGGPKKVGDYFCCENCTLLKTLEGAPKEVDGSFYCKGCQLLESLEGGPKEVGKFFSCSLCPKLKSLKGAPKEVGLDFYCKNCGTQFTKKDVKKVSKVKGKIYC